MLRFVGTGNKLFHHFQSDASATTSDENTFRHCGSYILKLAPGTFEDFKKLKINNTVHVSHLICQLIKLTYQDFSIICIL